MNQQFSIEEIRLFEENARKLRSDGIFETCTSLFKGIVSGLTGLVASVGKTNDRVESTALEATTR